jgi:hypothetical protein
VLESKYGSPKIVNDGVTIAREVELEDPVENIGAKLVRQAAARTNDTAGDGTTTATILSAAFIAEGLKIVAAGGRFDTEAWQLRGKGAAASCVSKNRNTYIVQKPGLQQQRGVGGGGRQRSGGKCGLGGRGLQCRSGGGGGGLRDSRSWQQVGGQILGVSSRY